MFSQVLISNQETLESGICIAPISIDLSYDPNDGKAHLQEGEHFAATIGAINRLKPKKVIIVLTGKLQRHNAMIEEDITEDEAIAKAKSAEDDWKKRNEIIFDRILAPYEVKYWEDYLENPNYAQLHEKIKREYKEVHSRLKNDISVVNLHFVNESTKRHKKIASEEQRPFDLDLAVESNKTYLLEEVAVVSLWKPEFCPEFGGVEQGKTVMIYPYGNSSISTAVYNCMYNACNTSDLRIEKIIHPPELFSSKSKVGADSYNKKPGKGPSPKNVDKLPRRQRSGSVASASDSKSEDATVENQSRQVKEAVRVILNLTAVDIKIQINALQGLVYELTNCTPSAGPTPNSSRPHSPSSLPPASSKDEQGIVTGAARAIMAHSNVFSSEALDSAPNHQPSISPSGINA